MGLSRNDMISAKKGQSLDMTHAVYGNRKENEKTKREARDPVGIACRVAILWCGSTLAQFKWVIVTSETNTLG